MPSDDAPEFVGVHELTTILGVSRQRVDQLARQDGFPEPVARLKVGRIWRTADVSAWATQHRRGTSTS